MKRIDAKKIIKKFVNGESYAQIANDVSGMSVERVKDCIATYETSVEEMDKLAPASKALWPLLREQGKILEIKDQMFDFVSKTMQELSTEKNISATQKARLFDKIAKMAQVADNISRLNQEKPTAINENRNKETKIDVNKLLEQLDTPEKQKAFLLNPNDFR